MSPIEPVCQAQFRYHVVRHLNLIAQLRPIQGIWPVRDCTSRTRGSAQQGVHNLLELAREIC